MYLGSWSRVSPRPRWLLAGCLFGRHDNSRPRAAHAMLSLINAGIQSRQVFAAPTSGELPTSLAIYLKTHVWMGMVLHFADSIWLGYIISAATWYHRRPLSKMLRSAQQPSLCIVIHLLIVSSSKRFIMIPICHLLQLFETADERCFCTLVCLTSLLIAARKMFKNYNFFYNCRRMIRGC